MKRADRVMGVKEFVKLCKPKILVTFLFVFILSYLISCGCEPRLNELLMGTFGVLTSISGANILNNYYDRDLDARMIRTSRRPIPSGKIRPNVALAFGLFLTSVSLVISFYLGLISLVILLAGFTSYILIYTIMAKRRFALSVFATAPAVASPVWFG
ncbi:MAG: UbiA family prenyltransferase, partial [Thaumarchaeota archaeon]|nr:UbiA family prenyltransferase [Nitrososphaerota archaeon]